MSALMEPDFLAKSERFAGKVHHICVVLPVSLIMSE